MTNGRLAESVLRHGAGTGAVELGASCRSTQRADRKHSVKMRGLCGGLMKAGVHLVAEPENTANHWSSVVRP